MIPITHQGLHILALGQRAGVEDAPDAPGFLAVVAEQDKDEASNTQTAPNAECCLAVAMPLPDLQIKPTELPPPASVSEPTLPGVTTHPLILPPEDQPQTAPLTPADVTASAQSKPDAPPALAVSPPLTAPTASPSESSPADVITPAPAGPAFAQPSAAVPPAFAAAHAPILTKAALARQSTPSSDLNGDQPLQIRRPAVLANPAPIGIKAPQRVALPAQALPIQILPDPVLSDQDLPNQASSGQIEPAPSPLLPTTPATPTHRISNAESAWQTRLQVTPSAIAPNQPDGATDLVPLAIAPPAAMAAATPPPANPPATGEPDHVDLKMSVRPNQLAFVALPQQARQGAAALPATANVAEPQPPATPAQQTPSIAAKSTPRALAPAHETTLVPDQTTLYAAHGPTEPHPNPTTPLSPALHPTPQTQPAPIPLPATVPAQLLHHVSAAKAGAIEVLLQPEELGHVKFQIQQQGESVRILLSAERPETLDLLRRHADHLLQEFRQSGFSQASLSFGQWGNQQRSPAPPPAPAAPYEPDVTETTTAPRQSPVPSAAPSGQGLNLRL